MIEYIKNWYQQNFSNPQIVILALCLIVGFTSVLLFGDLLAPLIASIVIAYVLDGVVGLLQHGRIPRLLALLLVFLGFIALLILILFGLIPKLSQQLTQFFRELRHVTRDNLLRHCRTNTDPCQIITENKVMELSAPCGPRLRRVKIFSPAVIP